MSNPYGDVRAAVAALLNDPEVPAYSIIPEAATAPFTYAFFPEPWIDYEGATFGGQIVHVAACIVVEHGDNEVTVAALEDEVLRVLDAFDASPDFVVERVGQPGSMNVNGQSCLAAVITASTEIRRT